MPAGGAGRRENHARTTPTRRRRRLRRATGRIERPAGDPRLVRTLAQIAAVWAVSDIGFYGLLPALGLEPSYNTAAMAVTLYYAF